MAISRMQMNRQLRAGGGIMNITPRENFGLGSKLKKFVRKIIPNEVSEIAVKAAPFVAPFNPLLAAGMAGIGGFDQTGRIGSSLKSGLMNYALGQGARFLGGAGFQKGINPFEGADFSGGIMEGIKSLGTSPIGTDTGLKLGQYEMFGNTPTQQITKGGGADFSQISSLDKIGPNTTGPKYSDLFGDLLKGDLGEKTQAVKDLGGKAIRDIFTKPVRENGKIIDYEIDKMAIGATIAGAASYIEAAKLAKEAGLVDDEDEYTEEMYEADKANYKDIYSSSLAGAFKDGGRVKYAFGSSDPMMEKSGIPSITLTEYEEDTGDMDEMDEIAYYIPGFSSKDYSRLFKVLAKEEGKNVDFKNLHKVLSNPGDYPDAIIEIKEMLGIKGKKDGGRVEYAMGSEVPVRKNEGGITELDYRKTGGFVPVGVKEKADDVPAMLSKNEFVFTADAVRNAGDGNVNKGAQKMYKLMKSLENKMVV